MTYGETVFACIAAAVVIMSLAAFVAFCIDKKRAVNGGDRIQEKTLLTLTALFGAFGACIGCAAAHHKTEKMYFKIVISVSVLLQTALLFYAGYIAFFYVQGA